MNAGYIVASIIKDKLNSMGYWAVVSWLASKIGSYFAKLIVSRVVAVGVYGAASYIAYLMGVSSAIAGPLAAIAGVVGGWL
ncbi:MAG: hypothetical protein WAS07_01315 [Micropruina sp.]|nr:hypothetical protein [Micropruina sp.]